MESPGLPTVRNPFLSFQKGKCQGTLQFTHFETDDLAMVRGENRGLVSFGEKMLPPGPKIPDGAGQACPASPCLTAHLTESY